MIAQKFKHIIWVGGVAVAATSLYLISLQVANEHKRLDTINLKIQATQHDIRQLNTEFSTRANLRQLEKWNGETLELTTPRAVQYLSDAGALDHLDRTALNSKTSMPTGAMAEVTSDAASVAVQRATAAQKAAQAQPTATRVASNKIVALDRALAEALGAGTGARAKQ